MTKHVTVIGGGVAGLSAALRLSQCDVQVDVIEKAPFMGGHAIRFACKATDACVKCGACIVEDKLGQAVKEQGIRLLTATYLKDLDNKERFHGQLVSNQAGIDPELCTDCGDCLNACPTDAILQGSSAFQKPFHALDLQKCLNTQGESCQACQECCPENAIQLDSKNLFADHQTDAIIIATGFSTYDPSNKPYGYNYFDNVITNQELEEILRKKTGALVTPGGHRIEKMAFIQCVGSRDARIDHLWCSRVCCGSSLRLSKLIQFRQPDTSITVFYIDIQNSGKDYNQFYDTAQMDIHFQRTIPADIYQLKDGRLEVSFVDSDSQDYMRKEFDLVVLAVGICPSPSLSELTQDMDVPMNTEGFIKISEANTGVFAAGTVTGPMSITESVASAEKAAWSTLQYINALHLNLA